MQSTRAAPPEIFLKKCGAFAGTLTVEPACIIDFWPRTVNSTRSPCPTLRHDRHRASLVRITSSLRADMIFGRDNREGRRAFAEKREPAFKGR